MAMTGIHSFSILMRPCVSGWNAVSQSPLQN